MPDDTSLETEKTSTFPAGASQHVRGKFQSEAQARELLARVVACLRTVGEYVDLSSLDGVTVAEDYGLALLQLDRGKKTSTALTPTTKLATGVAMTPLVLRNGEVKSHIVLNANEVASLLDLEGEGISRAVYIIAHECCHVEISSKFDRAFPGILMQKSFESFVEELRSNPMYGTWDEYAACRFSAAFGEDQTENHEGTLLLCLKNARDTANAAIRKYRMDHDHERVAREVYGAYGELIKFSGYFLGTVTGRGKSWKDRPEIVMALDGSWFEPFFIRLEKALSDIADEYGNWTDQSKFAVVGDILDEIVKQGGLSVETHFSGGFKVSAPYTRETMPF